MTAKNKFFPSIICLNAESSQYYLLILLSDVMDKVEMQGKTYRWARRWPGAAAAQMFSTAIPLCRAIEGKIPVVEWALRLPWRIPTSGYMRIWNSLTQPMWEMLNRQRTSSWVISVTHKQTRAVAKCSREHYVTREFMDGTEEMRELWGWREKPGRVIALWVRSSLRRAHAMRLAAAAIRG